MSLNYLVIKLLIRCLPFDSRQLRIPSHVSLLHVEQEVVGDDTPALQSVLQCDFVREGLLQHEREITAAINSGYVACEQQLGMSLLLLTTATKNAGCPAEFNFPNSWNKPSILYVGRKKMGIRVNVTRLSGNFALSFL